MIIISIIFYQILVRGVIFVSFALILTIMLIHLIRHIYM